MFTNIFKDKTISYGNGRRTLSGPLAIVVSLISIVWISFHVVLASGVVILLPMQVKITHIMFALCLCFLFAPLLKRWADRGPMTVDYLMIAATVASYGYLLMRYEELARLAGRYNHTDIVVGAIALAILFEAARRVVSGGLFILAVLAFLYAIFGRSLPMPFTHVGFGIKPLVHHLMLTGEGVFGFVLGVSAEIIIVFIVLGAVLQEVKIADFFLNLSRGVAGRSVGGPAKVAVLFSSMMGMVSGETSANVATTGAFTIPLMKRVGYPAYFAGAIETAASAGGQIMPPIMGATAFVIADALGVPYVRVVTAALLPAILYYIGVYATVHFRAVKLGLYEQNPEQLPSFLDVLLKQGYMLLPIGGIVAMLVMEYTPTMAAFWGGIVVAILLTLLNANTRLNPEKLVNIAERSARTAMSLAVAMALVGVLVGVASLTGVTMTISDKIFGLSGGWMPAAVGLTMIVAIILGMGVPTTPAYVLASISAAPVLLRMGIPDIVAHMFVFYFAVMSALTPPVCTGAYTAAGLAGANPNKVGFVSLRLALGGFIVPLIFVGYPSVLLIDDLSIVNLVYIVTTIAVVLVIIAGAFEGVLMSRLSMPSRIALGISAILMLMPSVYLAGPGWVMAGVITFLHWKGSRGASGVPVNQTN